MGIPRLIVTLEPYAEHEVLRDEHAVIDGPALAYHVLHLCRVHGTPQPSYHLLGQTAIRWLDELDKSGLRIRHVYFDGHLPSSKLPVRMERMIKAGFCIENYFASNPRGLPAPRSRAADPAPLFDVFEAAAYPGTKPPPDPGFLVPAVIDALRSSSRYRDLFSIVPGEADSFCARDVAQHGGGVVLTSDSDLLAHDLGRGKVVFLRDVYRIPSGDLSCLTFCPRKIHAKIGLLPSVEPWRLAYERKNSPNAALARLVVACSQPIADAVGYDEFRRQYLPQDAAAATAAGPVPSLLKLGTTWLQLNGLDPRVSELLVQMTRPDALDGSIFMPTMIENPQRGTVWEPSMPTRQLAYTLASSLLGCAPSFSVFEFRRVRQRGQKGRQVSLLSTDAIQPTINNLASLIKRLLGKNLKKSSNNVRETTPHGWILLAVLLDITACEDLGKRSHLLDTLEKASSPSAKPMPSAKSGSGRLPWDDLHFVAQVQAGLYSLRILTQILALMTPDNDDNKSKDQDTLNDSLRRLRISLSHLPSLVLFPGTLDVLEILRPAARAQAWDVIKASIPVVDDIPKPEAKREPRTLRKAERDEQRAKSAMGGPPPRAFRSAKNNMFGLLDDDS